MTDWRKLLFGEFSVKRLLSSLITIPIALYIGLGVYAYFFSDSVIFQPQPSSFRDDDSIIKLITPNGEKISAKFFKNATADFTILYSHGNADDINVLSPYFQELSNEGFNVFAYEYRGYGKSEGKPSEQNAYEDAETAYNYLINEQQISPEKIIIFGHSLGGAVAIDLASRKNCGGLIAESTFVTAFRVLTQISIYPFDKFQSISKIKNVNCPVLIIHGKRDRVTPFWHGERLFEVANEPKSNYWIDEAGHNDVSFAGGKNYFATIRNFSGKLEKISIK
jgi:abhydrolase domain-containing protein 17